MSAFNRLFIFGLALITGLSASALGRMQSKPPQNIVDNNPFGSALFYYQSYLFADDAQQNRTQVVFHFNLVNDLLTFFKQNDSTFQARYEIGMVIYNPKREAIAERFISGQKRAFSFAETNSRQVVHREKVEMSLPPGDYVAHIQLIDQESNQILKREKKLSIPALHTDRLQFSDLVFADEIDCTSDDVRQTLVANLRDVYDSRKSAFSSFVEIYVPEPDDSLVVVAQLFLENGQSISLDTTVYKTPVDKKIAHCFDFKNALRNPGRYTLRIRGDAGPLSARAERQFRVFWGDLDLTEKNSNVLVDQLKLIAPKEWIRQVRETDPAKHETLIEEFWRQRDPDPETPGNPLKTEFFLRVDYANRNFPEFFDNRQGWETDRGRTFVLNGPPTQVEKQPAELNRPTAEIWFYAHLNKRYIFSDRNGSGRYRLVKVE
ncbi:MAG TPA: GWxTD domain-containing protein [bacterium]|jgi:GWxTD domain-containing protein|nr:GWxTD domain-containing protein [bacterium]HNT64838.1 GWxTD domain-containing protein [bacterium]HOX84994.1 GWxTD domain-containing protein [bacterium]HPG44140.1 GWxTD domain-containing protein [bacterium]HPM96507.1 GWxTD domain-containing protein [bacterium]